MTKKIIRFGWKLTNRIQSNKWDKNLWYFIYWEKRSSVTYLWVTKVCESLGLEFEGEIRVHLWFRWFKLMGWLSGVSSCPDLFKEQGSIKSAHVCGSASWFELRRSLRISEKELLLAGKGYKTISPRVWTPQIHSQTDCVQMEEVQDPKHTSHSTKEQS